MISVNKNGAPDFNSLYLAIGYAVTKWEHLETRLLFLYSALACNDFIADVQPYSAIVGFRARISTIDRLLDHRLRNNMDLLKSCKDVLRRIERLSTRRNQIVHGQLADAKFEIVDGRGAKSFSGLYISNSVYNSPNNISISNKSYHFNHDDIIEFGNSFEKCRHDLNTLTDQCLELTPFRRSVASNEDEKP